MEERQDVTTTPQRQQGAGGSPGGIGQFLLGVGMVIAGGYLLLNSIRIVHGYGFGEGQHKSSKPAP